MKFFQFLVSVLTLSLLSACIGLGSYNGKSLEGIGDDPPLLRLQPKQLNILVIGGTSGVGLEVVKLSLQRGHKVTAVARRPERMPINNANLSTIKGDITNASSMMNIISKNQIVVSAVGIAPTRKKVTLFSRGITNTIEAMNTNGANRIVTVSAIGAGNSEGHGGFFFDRLLKPLTLSPDIKDKTLQESILKNSTLNWTIVRPGFLSDQKRSDSYRVLIALEGIKAGEIARQDVAHFIVAAIEDNLYSRQTVLLSR